VYLTVRPRRDEVVRSFPTCGHWRLFLWPTDVKPSLPFPFSELTLTGGDTIIRRLVFLGRRNEKGKLHWSAVALLFVGVWPSQVCSCFLCVFWPLKQSFDCGTQEPHNGPKLDQASRSLSLKHVRLFVFSVAWFFVVDPRSLESAAFVQDSRGDECPALHLSQPSGCLWLTLNKRAHAFKKNNVLSRLFCNVSFLFLNLY